MPKLREKAPEKVSFTIRYEPSMLARVDAYAERARVTRAEATRAVLAAGLDAVECGSSSSVTARTPMVNMRELAAVIVTEMLSEMDVDAWADAVRSADGKWSKNREDDDAR